jgi:hypothetical protein
MHRALLNKSAYTGKKKENKTLGVTDFVPGKFAKKKGMKNLISGGEFILLNFTFSRLVFKIY